MFQRSDTIGAGYAVAVDACGNMLCSAALRSAAPDQPLISKLFKRAP
jgi:hypothetical protein